jgi:hypothetical protein
VIAGIANADGRAASGHFACQRPTCYRYSQSKKRLRKP